MSPFSPPDRYQRANSELTSEGDGEHIAALSGPQQADVVVSFATSSKTTAIRTGRIISTTVPSRSPLASDRFSFFRHTLLPKRHERRITIPKPPAPPLMAAIEDPGKEGATHAFTETVQSEVLGDPG